MFLLNLWGLRLELIEIVDQGRIRAKAKAKYRSLSTTMQRNDMFTVLDSFI